MTAACEQPRGEPTVYLRKREMGHTHDGCAGEWDARAPMCGAAFASASFNSKPAGSMSGYVGVNREGRSTGRKGIVHIGQ